MTRVLWWLLALAGLAGSAAAMAAEAAGAVIVRIPDGAASRCINASTDQVWLTMRRVILNKERSLFSNEQYAGVVLNTMISGNAGSSAQKVTFPRMIETDIESYAAGHGVSIPVEFGLLEGFRLNQDGMRYTNVEFDFNVIRGKKKNGWGQGLDALVDITRRLPLPASPFADGFRFFADYANLVVGSSLQEKQADNIRQGNVRLAFSANGQCPNRTFESTGTIAIVFAGSGPESAGFVDINRISASQYCWAAELQPAFVLRFGKAAADGSCTPDTIMRNDYYGFFLNALPVQVASAARLSGSNPAGLGGLVDVHGNPDVEAIRRRLERAAQWDPGSGEPGPLDDLVQAGAVRPVALGVDAAATADALWRCQAHGMAAAQCLPRF